MIGTILLKVSGNPARPFGINSEGLRRRGFSASVLVELKRAYRTLYRSGLTLEEARVSISAQAEIVPELAPLAAFVAAEGRGILR